MTSNGPYSEATCMYEPKSEYIISVVANPNSILEHIMIFYPETFKLINRAQLDKLYNNFYPTTLFVDVYYKHNQCISLLNAINQCKNQTIQKRIDDCSLKSSKFMILKTIGDDLILCDGLINGLKIGKSIKCMNGYVHVLE